MTQAKPATGRAEPGPVRMGPTRISTLVVAGAGRRGGGLAADQQLLLQRHPPLPWLPVVTLAGLAVLEAYAAINTRARIERKPGREPVDPLLVARFVVLAKASALAGGHLRRLLRGADRLAARGADPRPPATIVRPAVGGLLASLALVGAALWLERSCRVPERPDDERGQDPRESRPGQR